MQYSTLDELFEVWKQAHINEDDASCQNTFPKNVFGEIPDIEKYKPSFCKDGFLSDRFNGVLFILKESDTQGEAETNDSFWFKNGADKESNGIKPTDSAWNKYCRNIKGYLEDALGSGIDYRECAYMNLNKRGGYGKCDNKQLLNYVNNERYKKFILNQIQIIKPKHIFCCGVDGESVYDLVLPIIQSSVSDVVVYKCRHLCCWTKRKIYSVKKLK